jgi:hypothetical protein
MEFRKLCELGHMGHVREYTSQEVVDVLSRCGFVPSEVIFRNPATRFEAVVTTYARLKPFFTLVAGKAHK